MTESSSPPKAEDGKESITTSKDDREREQDHEQEQEHDHETPNASKTSAVKDKRCTYCNQIFTSSSLGRHLDQYLFKKKPDGIHDVDEIRRLRSGITRRTARSSAKQDSPDNRTSHDPHSAPPLQLNPKGSGGKGYRFYLNQPSWHSTGVINDIPNSSQVSQLKIPTTPLDRTNRFASTSVPETARALELALKEVLDSVRAAANRATPRPSPFEFDLQTQTFPALCLHALPPPPTLFSAHPFPSPTSFPLDPPTLNQREAVQHALRAQIQQWKADQLSTMSSPTQTSASIQSFQGYPSRADTDMVERIAHQHEEMILRHLDLSLKHWMDLSPAAQRELWQLEVTRAFARESEKRKKSEEQLLRAQQEINQLRAQLDRLASCQWPREFVLFPPSVLPISPDVARELDRGESGLNAPESSRWDYDHLLSKWKRVVMHDKSIGRSSGGSGSPPVGFGNVDNSNVFTHANGSQPTQASNHVSPSSPSFQQPYIPHQQQQHYPHQRSHVTSNQPPSYETPDTNEPSDMSRPSKRMRTRNGQLETAHHSTELQSPRATWNTPPESGLAVNSSRTNSLLSPSLPGAPTFPVSSTTPPTPPATVTMTAPAGEPSNRHHSLASSSHIDPSRNDKPELTSQIKHTNANNRQQDSQSGSMNKPQDRHIDSNPNAMTASGFTSRPNDQQDHHQNVHRRSQQHFNDGGTQPPSSGMMMNSNIYTPRAHAYSP